MTTFQVFYDYMCPYVYRGTMFVDAVMSELGEPFEIDWRFFSLSQINSPDKDTWKIWEQDLESNDRYVEGLRAFWAAEAARQQGTDAFWAYHKALLTAIHPEDKDVTPELVAALAEECGLDTEQFVQDIQDRSLLARLKEDHTAAVAQHRVFGTPSFVFPGAEAAYLKLRQVPEAADAVKFWHNFYATVAEMPFVIEIKRPQ